MKGMFSLNELASELQRQSEAKVDYVADTRGMFFHTGSEATEATGGRPKGESRLDISGDGVTAIPPALRVNHVAHDQIATRLGIPKRYYERLRTELPVLLDENVNRLFRHKPETRMIRTLDGTARAFLSDAYRRLDNDEIASAILPILGEIPDLQIRSSALTDTRMHLKATTPRVSGTVVGQEVCAGVYIGNSEVGHGSVVVYPFVETLACSNGMIVQREGDGMMRRIHVGRRVDSDSAGRVFRDETVLADDRAFMMALADVVRAAVDEVRFRDLVRSMNEAAEGQRVQDVVAATRVLAKREDLGEHESRDVLQHLAEGGDLSRWGLVSAVTRAAEDVESYDRATELEALGGKILSYSNRDWTSVATAA